MQYQTRHIIPKSLLVLGAVLLGTVVFRELLIGGRLAEFGKLLRLVGLVLAGSLILIASFVSYFEYHGLGTQEGILRRGPREPICSITFDDGPNPIYTPQILDILKEAGIKATFFVVGKHVEKYPEIAKRIVGEGHEVGNHTYSHRDLIPSTKGLLKREVDRTDEIIQKIMGVKTTLFRPPRGIYSQAVRRALVNQGFKIILWTASSTDWRRINPGKILRRIRIYSRSGAIILFHDSGSLLGREGGNRSHTVEALPEVIEYLKEKREYEIVTIAQMFKKLEDEEIAATSAEVELRDETVQKVLEKT